MRKYYHLLFCQLLAFNCAADRAPVQKVNPAQCQPKYWTIKGELSPAVKGYDELLASLAKAPDPTRLINEYLRKDGLLLQLKTTDDNLRELNNYLLAEGASGYNVGLFMRRMQGFEGRLAAFFTTVYEVAKPESKTYLRKWLLPMGAWPASIDGFRLIYLEKLVGVCRDISYSVYLRVTDEGNYEAIASSEFSKPEEIPEAKCTAQRTFFHDSEYAKCMEFEDLSSKAKHILVWDEPVK